MNAPARLPAFPRPLAATTGTGHELGRSRRLCRAITRSAGSSFPLAFRLLSRPRRAAMDALYAFLRLTDDLTDETGEVEAKRARLAAWQTALEEALAGRFHHPVFPALADAVHRYDIPPHFLAAVVAGVGTDLQPVRYATFADLYPYCYRVASAVGLACLRIWGLRPGVAWAEADAAAEAAGIAFQLTNILRDLGEDLARGRVYLPADELAAFDMPPERWTDPDRRTAFRDLMRFQTGRARAFYRRGTRLERLLTDEGLAIFRVMNGTYRRLLDEIERRDYAVFDRRVRLPAWRKGLALLDGWLAKRGWA